MDALWFALTQRRARGRAMVCCKRGLMRRAVTAWAQVHARGVHKELLLRHARRFRWRHLLLAPWLAWLRFCEDKAVKAHHTQV